MTNNLLVLQSDFGLVDGAVSAMIGVALQEEPSLGVHHLCEGLKKLRLKSVFMRY